VIGGFFRNCLQMNEMGKLVGVIFTWTDCPNGGTDRFQTAFRCEKPY
jgi:hypothetical protein